MSKVISNSEATRQLELLTQKMEESSKFVDSMQQKLEGDHSYSIKEREVSYQARERHLGEVNQKLFHHENVNIRHDSFKGT
jgi:hypothetical protein